MRRHLKEARPLAALRLSAKLPPEARPSAKMLAGQRTDPPKELPRLFQVTGARDGSIQKLCLDTEGTGNIVVNGFYDLGASTSPPDPFPVIHLVP